MRTANDRRAVFALVWVVALAVLLVILGLTGSFRVMVVSGRSCPRIFAAALALALALSSGPHHRGVEGSQPTPGSGPAPSAMVVDAPVEGWGYPLRGTGALAAEIQKAIGRPVPTLANFEDGDRFRFDPPSVREGHHFILGIYSLQTKEDPEKIMGTPLVEKAANHIEKLAAVIESLKCSPRSDVRYVRIERFEGAAAASFWICLNDKKPYPTEPPRPPAPTPTPNPAIKEAYPLSGIQPLVDELRRLTGKPGRNVVIGIKGDRLRFAPLERAGRTVTVYGISSMDRARRCMTGATELLNELKRWQCFKRVRLKAVTWTVFEGKTVGVYVIELEG
ncbi:MAG: hypothetical protein HY815_20980 [Candidatus Riflebacteria bacterium]|nr:hypothetical protein [Candidatus Riflebacteria bacterium]